jgi:plastocyanin
MTPRRSLFLVAATVALPLLAGCSGHASPASPTPAPTPVGGAPIANVYILPGATALGANAFGDEPIVIHKGEQMHWKNVDLIAHNVVADTPSLPEFQTTGVLASGGERSFTLNTAGTTAIHCTIHPEMTGTLTVR